MNYRNYRYNVQKANGQRREFELFLPEGMKVLQSRDPREQGRDKNLAFGLVDERPGAASRIVMAAGAAPYQHLQEMAERARDDEPQLVRPGPAPDWQQLWIDYVKERTDAAVGRTRFYQSGNRSR